jgi:acyl-CoA thioester hydrolase
VTSIYITQKLPDRPPAFTRRLIAQHPHSPSLTRRTVNTITFDLDIYTFHVDFSGVVGPIAYSQWSEMAWLKLLDAIALPRHQLADRDLQPCLTASTMQYWEPLHLGDHVRAEIWITRLAAACVDLKIQFYNADHCNVAEGTQSWVFTDCQQGSPKILEPEIAARFQPYVRPEAD